VSTFGYARVSMAAAKSRKSQHVDNQVQRLLADGIPEANIYVDDGRSGKLRSRPEWDRLLTVLRKDDVLVATKLDRIGRSLVNLIDVVSLLGERGVQLRMLDQPIDTSTAMGKFFFQVMAALAELEASMTRERTLEGLASAKDRHGGKLPVRGPSIKPDQIETAKTLAVTHPEMSAARIADVIGVSRATLYRHVEVAALREGSQENGRSGPAAR
jgi:DNA invertase Pin-like site-specific DNA recombinase